MKRILVSLLIAFLIAGLSYAAKEDNSDDKTLRIEAANSCKNKEVPVRVLTPTGSPAKDAEIDVFSANRKIAYGKTDDQGIFTYKADKSGTHQITAKKNGYKDAEIYINISPQCASDTTTTTFTPITTTTSTTTTTTTTTTTLICNLDFICQKERGENYLNCVQDCPSGSADNYCDQAPDGICDIDCARTQDSDCTCNKDNKCDAGLEDYDNCPSDCRKGVKDGLCDMASDGICDLDCSETEDLDCKKFDYSLLVAPLLIILIVFGVVAALNLKREKKVMDVEKAKDDLIDSLINRLKDGEDPEALKKELAAQGKDLKILETAEKRIWQ